MPKPISLDLLIVFEAVAAERNVTRAARQLNMSQSAVSHALRRLRDVAGDPLFIRAGQGVQLTGYARDLAAEIRPLLQQMRRAVEKREFNPKEDKHSFRLMMSDFTAAIALKPVIENVLSQGPFIKIDVVIRPLDGILDRISGGEADFLLAPIDQVHDLEGIDVLDCGYPSVLMSSDHPLAAGELTLERYAAARHAYVPFDGLGHAPGTLDRELLKMGLRRDIVFKIPHMNLVPQALDHADLVMVAPAQLAAQYAQSYGLIARPLPIKLKPMTVKLIWHPLLAARPAEVWFRNFVPGLF